MPRTTLAVGVMAAFSVSALLAQDQPLHYCYGTDCYPKQNTTPAAQPKPSARRNAATVSIPAELHFCAQHCLTFTRENDGTLVNRINLPGQTGEKRVLAIQSFTSDSVVIHRTDTGSFPGDGMMKGKMQYGDSSAVGNGWAISWGKALDQLPGSDEERAEREGIPTGAQQQVSPLALFLGLVLGGSASGGSGGGDLPGRISSLQSQVDSARDECYRRTGTSGQPANDSSCDRQHSLEYQLSEARGQLGVEIQNLTEAHNKLSSDCNAGDRQACENQQKVDAQLARDKQFQVGSLFQ